MVRRLRTFCLLMPDPESINFIKQSEAIELPKRRLSTRIKFLLFGLTMMFVAGLFLSSGLARTGQTETHSDLSFLGSIKRLIVSGDKLVAGQDTDRVNILLLGVGGSGHDGPELTDTIIFGSLKPSTSQVGLISIPRDLNVNLPDYGYRKINNVNAFAESEQRGSGSSAVAGVVEQILAEPIHYTVKIDFNGFEEIIDDIGGLDVYIERDFIDPTYPLDDGLGGVEAVTFIQGWTHMDGATALKFARSRHGSNGEGSDFARAARQQKMLLAFKDKALSLGVLLNPGKLNRMLGTIQANVDTNLTLWEMMRFIKYIPDISSENIAMHVLDNHSGLLYDGNYNGAYVLLPYEEDWSELQLLADNIFNSDSTAKTVTNVNSRPIQSVTLEIQNGTATTGLASELAQLLESSGFNIASLGNATNRDTPRTAIYDLTNGAKDEELAVLQEYLSADVYMSTEGYLHTQIIVPDFVLPSTPGLEFVTSRTQVDFLIILGQDSVNLYAHRP